jgi:hypothetical protein
MFDISTICDYLGTLLFVAVFLFFAGSLIAGRWAGWRV